MLNLDKNNLEDYKITIDENKLNKILDNAISNDSSLIVGKLPIEEPIIPINNSPIISNQDDTSVLALTVRPVKKSLLNGLRVSFKVAVSTFFIQLARIFI